MKFTTLILAKLAWPTEEARTQTAITILIVANWRTVATEQLNPNWNSAKAASKHCTINYKISCRLYMDMCINLCIFTLFYCEPGSRSMRHAPSKRARTRKQANSQRNGERESAVATSIHLNHHHQSPRSRQQLQDNCFITRAAACLACSLAYGKKQPHACMRLLLPV